MSYDITIGNVIVGKDDDGEYRLDIEEAPEVQNAPRFPGDYPPSMGRPYRAPSYTGWADFCRDAGLYALFFDKERGLMREHPGMAALTVDHHATVRAALASWREAHPDAGPRFGGDIGDANLARLMWLDFWIGWALDNCERPGMENL